MNKILLLVSLFIVVSCSSTSKPSRYYSLSLNSESSVRAVKKNENLIKVLISPIRLTPFLDQQGLVMQKGEHEIIIANHHKWAEPLQQSIEKLLQRSLNSFSTEYYFERETTQWSTPPASVIMLRVEIDKFYATDKSSVVVAGRYQINKTNHTAVTEREFMITNNLSEDGFLHSVEVLERSVKNLAKEILTEMESSD